MTAGSVAGDLITFLIYSPFPKYSGGRENWLHHLAPHLGAHGRKVHVIAYATNRTPFYSVEKSGVGVVALPSVRYFFSAFKFLNRATFGLLKYVDIFFFYPIVAAIRLAWTRPRSLVCMNPIPEGIAALLAGIPYVVSVRGDVPKGLADPFTFLERPFRWLERQILLRARKVLANGADTQQRLAGAGIGSTLVPNGVDFARFAEPAPRSEVGAELERRSGGRPIIAFIATLDAMRGVIDAIDCAAELKAREPNFMLAMVGKGDTGRFESRLQARGLAGWVEFMGETKSVPDVLGRSSVFLALSRGNGISMSALEAMAAGVPIVARDVLTYRQLIEHGRSGLLASDPTALAECCLQLLRDPERALALGREAQAVARNYDWPRIAEVFLAAIS